MNDDDCFWPHVEKFFSQSFFYSLCLCMHLNHHILLIYDFSNYLGNELWVLANIVYITEYRVPYSYLVWNPFFGPYTT